MKMYVRIKNAKSVLTNDEMEAINDLHAKLDEMTDEQTTQEHEKILARP